MILIPATGLSHLETRSEQHTTSDAEKSCGYMGYDLVQGHYEVDMQRIITIQVREKSGSDKVKSWELSPKSSQSLTDGRPEVVSREDNVDIALTPVRSKVEAHHKYEVSV